MIYTMNFMKNGMKVVNYKKKQENSIDTIKKICDFQILKKCMTTL